MVPNVYNFTPCFLLESHQARKRTGIWDILSHSLRNQFAVDLLVLDTVNGAFTKLHLVFSQSPCLVSKNILHLWHSKRKNVYSEWSEVKFISDLNRNLFHIFTRDEKPMMKYHTQTQRHTPAPAPR